MYNSRPFTAYVGVYTRTTTISCLTMSGIEVAGLVLGALPLLISAIEYYEASLDRATAFFKWKDELDKAMRELWIQRSYFELTLGNLLQGVASPLEVQSMMFDFKNDLWKSPELADSLRNKLQAAYSVYIYTIREMEGYMVALAKNLNIDRQEVRLSWE